MVMAAGRSANQQTGNGQPMTCLNPICFYLETYNYLLPNKGIHLLNSNQKRGFNLLPQLLEPENPSFVIATTSKPCFFAVEETEGTMEEVSSFI